MKAAGVAGAVVLLVLVSAFRLGDKPLFADKRLSERAAKELTANVKGQLKSQKGKYVAPQR